MNLGKLNSKNEMVHCRIISKKQNEYEILMYSLLIDLEKIHGFTRVVSVNIETGAIRKARKKTVAKKTLKQIHTYLDKYGNYESHISDNEIDLLKFSIARVYF